MQLLKPVPRLSTSRVSVLYTTMPNSVLSLAFFLLSTKTKNPDIFYVHLFLSTSLLP